MLHEKYRPTTFDGVIGQQHIVRSLRPIIEQRRAHAFLFSGFSGCGKTTIARICASMLGCSEPLEIDGATYTGVDAMRGVVRSTHYVPMMGTCTVIIIDECHRLSRNAWDATLKAIEEPGSAVYWFLCTTEPDKLPATVKTRCAAYNVRLIKVNELRALVDRVRVTENLNLIPDIVDLCVDAAKGSARQALVNLNVVRDCELLESAQELLEGTAGSPRAVNLARHLMTQGFDAAKAREMLRDMKGESPESVRMTVFHYMAAVAMNTGNQWHLMVLSEFEKPAIEGNKLGDILLRVMRLRWRAK